MWALAWAIATLVAPQAWGQTTSAVNLSKPVRVLVGFAAGGALDLTARVIANKWPDNNSGQPMIVENRPGASSNLAAEVVVKAAADGQTLYMGSYVNAVSPSMFLKLNYDPVKDLAPIAKWLLPLRFCWSTPHLRCVTYKTWWHWQIPDVASFRTRLPVMVVLRT